MQHPIDTMLQFDANANTHVNIDTGVNGPFNFDSDIDANKKQMSSVNKASGSTSYFRYYLSFLMLC